MDELIKNKYKNLKNELENIGSGVIAFSGGVDSTLLLKAAHNSMKGQIIAVTAQTKTFPGRELTTAARFCADEKIRLILFDFDMLSVEGFAQNPVNRCYLCKSELFKRIWAIAGTEGLNTVLEGSNTDDGFDFRPGMQALKEQSVRSPLKEAGLSKEDIRIISKELGLKTWDKPSFACLATRFEYGETLTAEKLCMVDRAEQYLWDMGFKQVRVRVHGSLARIELDETEIHGLFGEERNTIHNALRELGFSYVSADIMGYRSGSMNESLHDI